MNEGRLIADTLESVLVGLAESLREAQEELSATPPLDRFGRPLPIYQVPHLDFELDFRLRTEEKTGGGMRLYFAPVASGETSREITSRITGRFVAVPPGGGLPLPVLTIATRSAGSDRVLTLTAANDAGELLAGATVEINVDRDASVALSAAAGVAAPRLNAVAFDTAAPVTDDAGQATVTVSLGAALQRAAVIVIAAELGTETVRITLGKDIGA